MGEDNLNARAIGAVFVLLLALGGWFVVNQEPTGARSCVPIEIAGVTVVHGRRSDVRYFNIVSLDTPSEEYAVPFDGTFPESYVGPGALWISTGKWTGSQHFRLTGRCVDSD
jgi:hypothetical protein